MAKKEDEEVQKVSAELIEKVGGKDKLRRAELPLDDYGTETLEVIIAVPSRRVQAQYLKYARVDPGKAFNILVRNCLLTQRDRVLADDDLFMAAVSAIGEIIPIRESVIKKY